VKDDKIISTTHWEKIDGEYVEKVMLSKATEKGTTLQNDKGTRYPGGNEIVPP
jgi:hypothetical protein